jgi:maleylpyruvate isomerase
MDAERIDRDITGCAAAHQRLLGDLDGLTDEQVRSESVLPKWTVGHVLNHLVRNAEGISRVFAAAADGRVVERYPGGLAGRDAGIEDGADRPAGELVADVRSTIWRLEQAWATAPPTVWQQGRGLEPSGAEVPVAVFPYKRWREVEVHHADLGLGFTFDDWSDQFVAAGLDEQLPALSGRIEGGLAATEIDALRAELGHRRLLAWTFGRWTTEGLPTLARWE